MRFATPQPEHSQAMDSYGRWIRRARRDRLGNASALPPAMESYLWCVVLAAGSGRRLASVTGSTPKQFWRPVGRESLVEQTLARLAPMCPAERTVAVVADSHREYVRDWFTARAPARVVFQSDDRGTAAGVLFGLLPVLSSDPEAVVLITPSDHGVGNPDVFRRGILEAVVHVQCHDSIILFGVEPSAAQADYGWITLGPSEISNGVRPVASFVEKPPAETARRLWSSGAVWNTMVFVAKARTLFQLCLEQLPDLTTIFADCLTVPQETRERFLSDHYRHLKAYDFSRDVLTPARTLFAYMWPATMGWSDLGTPERLARWLGARSVQHARPEHSAFSRAEATASRAGR